MTPRSIALIENKGPDNLRDVLKSKLAQAVEAYIAVAFLTQSGLDEIAQPLRQVAVGGQVKLITGLYQKVTEPRALKTLLKIQDETRGRFSARLSTEPQFHRKFYLLKSKREATLIIGSSNLTREGLQSGGELNLMLSLPEDDAFVAELEEAFEQEWENRAVPLSAQCIEKYEKSKGKYKAPSYTRSELRKILGTTLTHQRATPTTDGARFWRDCVIRFLDPRTEQVIKESTGWDRQGYWWFSVGRKNPYRIGDRILLFDLNKDAETLQLVEVTDVARTKVPTPDGRNFVAYKSVQGYGRRLTETLWKQLEDERITKKNVRTRKQLSEGAAKRLMDLIRKKRRRKKDRS